jgi:hypothetical protein
MQKQLLTFMLSAGLAALASPSQAQVFRPGWLLPAQGDTLRGEIEDNAWVDTPTQVRFRTAPGAAITSYQSTNLRSFRLLGRRYFRYETLPIDRAAQTAPDRLPEVLVRDQHSEALLAEVLVDGPAKLLYSPINNVQHFFVQREGEPYLELSERAYVRLENGQRFMVDANNYRGELMRYFGDCPAVTQRLAATPFTSAGMVALVQAYNQQCTASPQASTVYKSQENSLGLRLALVAGGRYNQSQLRAPAYTANAALDGQSQDGRVHPVGGIALDLLSLGHRASLHVAGLLTQVGGQAALAVAPTPLTTQLTNRLTVLELRAGMRYFFRTGRYGQQLFGGAGFAFPYAPGKDKAHLTYSSPTEPSLFVNSLPDAYPSSSLLPYLEVGVRRNRLAFALDGRWQRTGSCPIFTTLTPPLGLSYTFSPELYTYRNWYASAMLSFDLVRSRG